MSQDMSHGESTSFIKKALYKLIPAGTPAFLEPHPQACLRRPTLREGGSGDKKAMNDTTKHSNKHRLFLGLESMTSVRSLILSENLTSWKDPSPRDGGENFCICKREPFIR